MLPLTGHTGAITALAFSVDGERLASTSKDGTIRVWLPPIEERNVSVTPSMGLSVTFSPDGRHLWIGTEDGRLLAMEIGDSAAPTQLWKSPFATGVTGIRSVQGGQILAVATGSRKSPQMGGIQYIAFDPTRKTALPVRDAAGVLCLVDCPESRQLAWSNGNREVIVQETAKPDPIVLRTRVTVPSLSIAPDGKSVAVAADWTIKIYELKHKSEQLVMRGHKGIVNAVAFTPDGRCLLSGSGDKTVRLWEPNSGREIETLMFPINRITTLAVAPDGLRAAVGDDLGNILMWDLDNF